MWARYAHAAPTAHSSFGSLTRHVHRRCFGPGQIRGTSKFAAATIIHRGGATSIRIHAATTSEIHVWLPPLLTPPLSVPRAMSTLNGTLRLMFPDMLFNYQTRSFASDARLGPTVPIDRRAERGLSLATRAKSAPTDAAQSVWRCNACGSARRLPARGLALSRWYVWKEHRRRHHATTAPPCTASTTTLFRRCRHRSARSF